MASESKKEKTKKLLLRTALLLTVLAAVFLVSGTAEENTKYRIEENHEASGKYYPYKVVSDSAVLYLAQEDIDLMGEEAYYAGLDMVLKYMEDDFHEAKEILKDYLKDEIPPVRISTCFSDNSDRAKSCDALYYDQYVGIRLYKGWDQAASSLLHEYVHYLTMDRFRYRITGGFWCEGIAEYVSTLRCSNQMAKAVNYGMNDHIAFLTPYGFADEEGKVDIQKLSYGIAALWDTEPYIGAKYTPVFGSTMTMSKRTQEHPTMDRLTYKQAACFMEYLVSLYGEETVFSHMACDEKGFLVIYGRSFEKLCNEWKQENLKRCAELGLDLDP